MHLAAIEVRKETGDALGRPKSDAERQRPRVIILLRPTRYSLYARCIIPWVEGIGGQGIIVLMAMIMSSNTKLNLTNVIVSYQFMYGSGISYGATVVWNFSFIAKK
jgi:hypothetical protein